MLRVHDDNKEVFDVCFNDKYNVICEFTASGKTYLRGLMRAYCNTNHIEFVELSSINEITGSVYAMSKISTDSESVLFIDNADILMNKDLEFAIYRSAAKFKILILHDMSKMPHIQYTMGGLYALYNEGRLLINRRVGQL